MTEAVYPKLAEALPELKGFAASADQALTQKSRDLAYAGLIRALADADITAEKIVEALDQVNTWGEHKAVLEELAQMVESLNAKAAERDQELAEKAQSLTQAQEQIAGLQEQLAAREQQQQKSASQTREADGDGDIADAFNGASATRSSARSKPSRDPQATVYEARIGQLEADLKETRETLKATEDANANLSRDLLAQRQANADLTATLDRKGADDAGIIRAALEGAIAKIMQPPAQTIAPRAGAGAIEHIQAYFANALQPMSKITKFREDITALMQICADATGLKLQVSRDDTGSFMNRSAADPLAYAELTTYSIHYGQSYKYKFGLLINGSDYWLYSSLDQELRKLLRAISYTRPGRTDGLIHRKSDSGTLYIPQVGGLEPIQQGDKLNTKKVSEIVLATMIKETSQVREIAKILRPLGYTLSTSSPA